MDIMTGNDYGSFRLLFHVLFIGQTGLSRKRGGDGLKGGGVSSVKPVSINIHVDKNRYYP